MKVFLYEMVADFKISKVKLYLNKSAWFLKVNREQKDAALIFPCHKYFPFLILNVKLEYLKKIKKG